MDKKTVNVNPSEIQSFEHFTFTLPSGDKITIRETTGADDDIMSKVDPMLEHINKYIANIVVEPKLTPNDVKKLKVRDKYYILMKSRIFNLGPELVFKHIFQDGSEYQVTEDLSIFDHDYSKPLPEGSLAPLPYPEDAGTEVEHTLSSGLTFKFEYFTGLHERKLLSNKKINLQNLEVNAVLTTRNFQLQSDAGEWILIQNFHMLKSRQAAEIRKYVLDHDPEWVAPITIEHPSGKASEFVSAFQLDDFFFPRD